MTVVVTQPSAVSCDRALRCREVAEGLRFMLVWEIVIAVVFWASGLTLGWIYVGYPLWVWRAAKSNWTTAPRTAPADRISIVIAAWNEAANLPRKVQNLLQSDIADQIDEIVIGSDGSTDDTVAVLVRMNESRLRIIPFSSRRGKPAVLNELIPTCQGSIIVLADSRQEFAKDTLRRLVENFVNPLCGVVSAELVFRQSPGQPAAAQGVGFYWRYEKFIRKCESAAYGVPGATGACYAIRKSLFKPIPDETLLDDVAIPMLIAAQGYHVGFEPRAIIYDDPSASTTQESTRKRRTIAGVAQLVHVWPGWMLPGGHPLWFEFLSHKVLRLASPLLLAAVFLTNAALILHPLYQVLFSVQVCFLLAGLVGWRYQQLGRRSACFGPCLMFLTLNWTTVLALFDAARAKYRVTWDRASPTST